jgi:hypothetical protein
MATEFNKLSRDGSRFRCLNGEQTDVSRTISVLVTRVPDDSKRSRNVGFPRPSNQMKWLLAWESLT